jgi:uncharacterized protein YkwD
MLRWITLLLALFAVTGSSATAEPGLLGQPLVPLPLSASGAASPAALQLLRGDVVRELNRVRAARGLRTLRGTHELATAARKHSLQMGRRGFFAHESADGTPFWRRIERFYGGRGFRSWAVGENIFWQSPAAAAAVGVVRSWLASPGHRANVLSRDWRDVGVGAVSLPTAPGVYRGSPVTIVTVDFGKRRR